MGSDTPIGKAGKWLGLGQQGEYYSPTAYNNPAEQQMQDLSKGYGDTSLNTALAQYGQGNYDINNLLNNPQYSAAASDMLAMSPVASQKFATEQVQNNGILGKLFGKGGAMDRADLEEQDLAKRGYSLQPEDYEAYGQTSGNIARLFGQQEQNTAADLASRGLAAAPSGAAGVAYSGLQGNKNEQLARAQTDIAQKRMQMNLERLNQTRQYLSGLGGLGEKSIMDTRAANLAGVGQKQGFLGQTAQQGLGSWQAQNAANMASMQNKQGEKSPGLGELFGAGLGKSVFNLGSNIVPSAETKKENGEKATSTATTGGTGS